MYSHDELDLIETVKTVKTNEDGTYRIPLSPGEYDLLIDKPGYLDVIVIQITIQNKTEIDLGETTMIAGDITKDGLVELDDMTILNQNYGCVADVNENYNINMDYTEDGMVELDDMTILNQNYGQVRNIINYKEGGI